MIGPILGLDSSAIVRLQLFYISACKAARFAYKPCFETSTGAVVYHLSKALLQLQCYRGSGFAEAWNPRIDVKIYRE